jgi:hypothetical protein
MAKTIKKIPFDFVVENLHALDPVVKPMFGAHGIYVGNKIVLILRDKDDVDSGVWLATTVEHHKSLQKDFPNMRSIKVFGPGISSWQVLYKEDIDFEEKVNLACDLISKNDPRIGKIPKAKSPKKKKI